MRSSKKLLAVMLAAFAFLCTACGSSDDSEASLMKESISATAATLKLECTNAKEAENEKQQVIILTNTPSWWPDDVPSPASGEFAYEAEESGMGIYNCTDSDVDKFEERLENAGFSELKGDDLEAKYPADTYGTVEAYSDDTYDVVIWRPNDGQGEILIFDSATQTLVSDK